MSKKTLKFHVESDDYFGTLATTLSLIEENAKNIKEYRKNLKNIVKDLMYLQKGYKIVKK